MRRPSDSAYLWFLTPSLSGLCRIKACNSSLIVMSLMMTTILPVLFCPVHCQSKRPSPPYSREARFLSTPFEMLSESLSRSSSLMFKLIDDSDKNKLLGGEGGPGGYGSKTNSGEQEPKLQAEEEDKQQQPQEQRQKERQQVLPSVATTEESLVTTGGFGLRDDNEIYSTDSIPFMDPTTTESDYGVFGQSQDEDFPGSLAAANDDYIAPIELVKESKQSEENQASDESADKERSDLPSYKWRLGRRPGPVISSEGLLPSKYEEVYPVVVCDDPKNCSRPPVARFPYSRPSPPQPSVYAVRRRIPKPSANENHKFTPIIRKYSYRVTPNENQASAKSNSATPTTSAAATRFSKTIGVANSNIASSALTTTATTTTTTTSSTSTTTISTIITPTTTTTTTTSTTTTVTTTKAKMETIYRQQVIRRRPGGFLNGRPTRPTRGRRPYFRARQPTTTSALESINGIDEESVQPTGNARIAETFDFNDPDINDMSLAELQNFMLAKGGVREPGSTSTQRISTTRRSTTTSKSPTRETFPTYPTISETVPPNFFDDVYKFTYSIITASSTPSTSITPKRSTSTTTVHPTTFTTTATTTTTTSSTTIITTTTTTTTATTTTITTTKSATTTITPSSWRGRESMSIQRFTPKQFEPSRTRYQPKQNPKLHFTSKKKRRKSKPRTNLSLFGIGLPDIPRPEDDNLLGSDSFDESSFGRKQSKQKTRAESNRDLEIDEKKLFGIPSKPLHSEQPKTANYLPDSSLTKSLFDMLESQKEAASEDPNSHAFEHFSTRVISTTPANAPYLPSTTKTPAPSLFRDESEYQEEYLEDYDDYLQELADALQKSPSKKTKHVTTTTTTTAPPITTTTEIPSILLPVEHREESYGGTLLEEPEPLVGKGRNPEAMDVFKDFKSATDSSLFDDDQSSVFSVKGENSFMKFQLGTPVEHSNFKSSGSVLNLRNNDHNNSNNNNHNDEQKHLEPTITTTKPRRTYLDQSRRQKPETKDREQHLPNSPKDEQDSLFDDLDSPFVNQEQKRILRKPYDNAYLNYFHPNHKYPGHATAFTVRPSPTTTTTYAKPESFTIRFKTSPKDQTPFTVPSTPSSSAAPSPAPTFPSTTTRSPTYQKSATNTPFIAKFTPSKPIPSVPRRVVYSSDANRTPRPQKSSAQPTRRRFKPLPLKSFARPFTTRRPLVMKDGPSSFHSSNSNSFSSGTKIQQPSQFNSDFEASYREIPETPLPSSKSKPFSSFRPFNGGSHYEPSKKPFTVRPNPSIIPPVNFVHPANIARTKPHHFFGKHVFQDHDVRLKRPMDSAELPQFHRYQKFNEMPSKPKIQNHQHSQPSPTFSVSQPQTLAMFKEAKTESSSASPSIFGQYKLDGMTIESNEENYDYTGGEYVYESDSPGFTDFGLSEKIKSEEEIMDNMKAEDLKEYENEGEYQDEREYSDDEEEEQPMADPIGSIQKSKSDANIRVEFGDLSFEIEGALPDRPLGGPSNRDQQPLPSLPISTADGKHYLTNPYGSDFIRLEVDEDRFHHNKTNGMGVHHIPLMIKKSIATERVAVSQPSPSRPNRGGVHKQSNRRRPQGPDSGRPYSPRTQRPSSPLAGAKPSFIPPVRLPPHSSVRPKNSPQPAGISGRPQKQQNTDLMHLPMAVMKEAMDHLPSAIHSLPIFVQKLMSSPGSWMGKTFNGRELQPDSN